MSGGQYFFPKMRMALQKIIKIKFSKYNVNSAIYLSIIKTLCIIGFRESYKIRSNRTKNLNISQQESVTKTAMRIRIRTNNEIRHWIIKFVFQHQRNIKYEDILLIDVTLYVIRTVSSTPRSKL